MDGTIADFYGVDGWLDYLITGDATPYRVAKPLVNLNSLARILNRLQNEGYKIGIISWLSKNGTPDYNKEVTVTKEKWLKKHLKSVNWDVIHIVEYGTPKYKFGTEDDILFDDEERNRNDWIGTAFNEENIIEILKGIF